MADKNLATKREDVLKAVGVRLAFTDALFEPKGYKGGKPKFSCKFLIPKDSTIATDAKNLIFAAAKAAWGDDATKILAQLKAENKLCLTDGDIKDYDGYAGNYVVSASNKTRPTLLGASKQQLSEKDGVLYSGCYVVAHLSFWAQDNDFGKRINCNLLGVQFYAPGEAFTGGGVASVDEFDEIPQAASSTLSGDNASFM